MNRFQPYIPFFIFNLLLLSAGSIFCQTEILQFNEFTLDKVISSIEKQSNYVFNYDPQLLQDFSFSGDVNMKNINEALKLVFEQSPYTYDINVKTILIYKAEPQIYRVCGIITDAISEELLIGANVYTTNTYIGSQTDNNGFFDFSLTAEKNQSIDISYIGYHTYRFLASSLSEDECIDISLIVNEDLIGEEIIIKDYILDGISQGDSYSSLNLKYDRLSRNHSNVEHDILKTTQLLSGITSIDDSATNLQIRGSSPGQNLILWEGTPIYNAGHIFGMISAINPFSVKNIDIYKGAHDSRYDNRVGGIIDISLSDQINNKAHGSVGSTLTEVHGNLDVPLTQDKLSLEIAGRQNFANIYNSPALQSYTDKVFQFSIIDDQANSGNELNKNQSLYYYDWNAKILYKPSDRLQLNIGTYHNHQDFEYSYGLENDSYQAVDDIKVNTSIINAEIQWQANQNWTAKVALYNSEYANMYSTEGLENGITVLSNDQTNGIKNYNITFSNEISLTSKLKLDFGYAYDKKKINLQLGSNTGFDPSLIPIGEEVATFQNTFQSLSYTNKHLKIEGGNRSSYYQEINSWFHSPRINLQYALSSSLKLKADGGIYQQFLSQLININNTQISVDNPLWILNTSESQLSQNANKYALGIIYNKKGWLIDIEAYHNQVKGLSTLSPLLGGLSNVSVFSTGSSKVKGIDALLKKQWGGLNTWINYSFGIAEYEFPQFSDTPISAPNDIRHNISLITSYKIKNLQLSITGHFHSGLPYTQPFLQLNEDDPNAEPPFLFLLGYDDYNTFRLKPYLRGDFNASYRFDLNTSGSLQSEISFSLLNVFNRNNISNRGYYVDYDDDTTLYSLAYAEKGMLGRTPLLLIRFYW